MINVLFFGNLAAKTKTREAQIEADNIKTVSDLLKILMEKYPELPKSYYMVAVNQEKVDADSIVKDGDEVALMPPFSGGKI